MSWFFQFFFSLDAEEPVVRVAVLVVEAVPVQLSSYRHLARHPQCLTALLKSHFGVLDFGGFALQAEVQFRLQDIGPQAEYPEAHWIDPRHALPENSYAFALENDVPRVSCHQRLLGEGDDVGVLPFQHLTAHKAEAGLGLKVGMKMRGHRNEAGSGHRALGLGLEPLALGIGSILLEVGFPGTGLTKAR